MKLFAALASLLLALPLAAQTAPAASPFASLAFLEGPWEVHTAASGPSVTGTYAFRPELKGHILARRGSADTCKGPADFDCDHSDMLYVFVDGPGAPLHAIYFDNEGHTIHYDVTTPDATTAVFLSDAAHPGPQFRLTYHLASGIMTGKFEMHMPGSADWHTYLEWSGPKAKS